MVSIWSASNGFVDDLNVNQVRPFEAALFAYMRSARPELLTAVREKKTIDKELTEKLQGALKDFKERFVAQAKATTA